MGCLQAGCLLCGPCPWSVCVCLCVWWELEAVSELVTKGNLWSMCVRDALQGTGDML